VTKSPEPELAPPSGAVERWLDAIEAVLWIGLLLLGSVVALAVLRETTGEAEIASEKLVAPSGLIEAEQLKLLGQSRAFSFWLQPTSSFGGGRWSQDGQMLGFGTQHGDWVDLELPEREPGKARLEIFLTRAADYGIVTVSLNGTPLGAPIDLFSDQGVVPTDAIDLGVVDLHRQGDVLRIAVVDKNAKSAPPHFQFGVDGIRISSP
jgi:hypothetical protein